MSCLSCLSYLMVLLCPSTVLAPGFCFVLLLVLQLKNLTSLEFKIPPNPGPFLVVFPQVAISGDRGIASKHCCGSVGPCLHFKRDLGRG